MADHSETSSPPPECTDGDDSSSGVEEPLEVPTLSVNAAEVEVHSDIHSEAQASGRTVSIEHSDTKKPRVHRLVSRHADAFNGGVIEGEEEFDFSNAFNPEAHVEPFNEAEANDDPSAASSSRSSNNSQSRSDYEEFDIGTSKIHHYDDAPSSCRYYTDDEEITVKESAGAMAEDDPISKRPTLLGRKLQKAGHCVKSMARKPYAAAAKFTSYCKKRLS
ncbi:uncharacterized protein BXIN_2850 [Babesia sp. Xinjiang]|uniref:uncharacterized protein n=1 Tax=Babesia sp. Xinjiang TaxID=462227 RepID=UPI000A22D339|nr:uncharacterized protein BXIN_2850 [Babesia sp. Xinjiang]ORM39505.1 hypothetical protein BXIN_2850 [Babesia sp. Xinjiang]